MGNVKLFEKEFSFSFRRKFYYVIKVIEVVIQFIINIYCCSESVKIEAICDVMN